MNTGYPGLASLLGHADGFGMFKRFAALNMRNLLYMQAELLALEDELERSTLNDSLDTSRSAYSKSAEKLRASAQSSDPKDKEQWDKALEVRAKLKEYNAALLQYAAVCDLKDASKFDFDAVRYWITKPDLATHFESMAEARPWRKDQMPDMKDISGGRQFDPFIRFLAEKVVPWLFQKVTHRFKKLNAHGLPQWNDSIYYTLAKLLAVLISTLFPSIAVIVLYFIQDLAIRLWVVLIFSWVFSTVLAVFTNARPVEIFAATAACASVQVVFVGSTNLSEKS